MKKTVIIAFLCFLGFSQIQAQSKFRPGIRAGLNASRFTQTSDVNERYYRKTDFYAGIYAGLHLSKYYALQPEVVYSRQGSGREYIDFNNVIHDTKINTSYLSLSLANKFTFGKFNFHLGPVLDIKINDRNKKLGSTYTSTNYYRQTDSDLISEIDMGFFVGAGFNFTKNVGAELRIKKGFIPVFDNFDENNVVIQAGLTYTFDIK